MSDPTYRPGTPLAKQAYHACQDALKGRTENEFLNLGDNEHRTAAQPILYYQSQILPIDAGLGGGLYGVSTIVADEGVGKTTLAMSVAIEAAASEQWQVCYFAAEDDLSGLGARFDTYVSAHPGSEGCVGNLHLFQAGRGQSPKELTIDIAMAIDKESNVPVLVVLDSINTITELSLYNYLEGLKQFALWATLSRRLSQGAASFLIVSETNKLGAAKGGKLSFWSDVIIRMKRLAENVVNISVVKSRRTPGVRDYGRFVRHMGHGRFYQEGDVPLHAVRASAHNNAPKQEDLL